MEAFRATIAKIDFVLVPELLMILCELLGSRNELVSQEQFDEVLQG